MTVRVAVVGAGISGLCFARSLDEAARRQGVPLELRVFEAAAHAGGTIRTHFRDGFLLEDGPDAFLTEKPQAIDLCRQLGLEPELIGVGAAHRRVLVVRNGRPRPLPADFQMLAPSAWRALVDAPLSVAGKVRLAFESVLPPRLDEADESVGAFARRRFGREAFERIVQPLLGAVYTGDPEKLSVRCLLPRFAEMERRGGSIMRTLMKRRAAGPKRPAEGGPRYGLFASFRRGMSTLPEALERGLPEGVLRLSTPVQWLARDGSGQWLVHAGPGAPYRADALCVAAGAPAASKLLMFEAPKLAKALAVVPHETVATLNLAWKESEVRHPLDAVGLVSPATEGRPVLACSFSSRKFSGRAPQGAVLLRAFAGGHFGKRWMEMGDRELTEAMTEDLKRLLGISRPPFFSRLARFRAQMPQAEIGHESRTARIAAEQAGAPGLFVTGPAIRGTGIPDCVAHAQEQAARCFTEMRRASAARREAAV